MSQFFSQYFDIHFMAKHFDQVLSGFETTLLLWAISGVLALLWGLILSLLRQTPGRLGLIVRIPTIAYIDAFRGIPLLMVILLIYGGFGALSSSNATPGPIPEFFAVPAWLGKPSAFWYGVMALVITYGAYMAEVYRAGIESVPEGQTEAARSLGMSHGQTMRFVIVPQAIRRVIPPLLNDLIALMKDTSLVSFISLSEVVLVGTDLQSKTFNSSALTLGATG
jgi:polar amino acid transport system permease protein